MKEDLLQIYANSFRTNWQLPAVADYFGSTKLSYGDLARRIARIHLFFKTIGIKKGDKIALLGKNDVRWVTTYMATLTYGAVIVPILPDFTPNDAMHIVNHSDSVLLYVSEHIWETLDFDKMPNIMTAISLDNGQLLAEHTSRGKRASKALAIIQQLFHKQYPKGFGPDDINYPYIDHNEVAEINYTSGTTGFSKGVMLTLNNLAGNVVFGVQSHLHYPGSRVLSFLPLAHAYGCAFDMLTPLAAGSFITVFGKVPAPKLLVKALKDVKPNLILSVPLVLEKIYRNMLQPVLSKPAMKRLLMLPVINKRIYAKIRKQLMDAFGGEFEQIIIGGAPLNAEVEAFLIRIKFPFTVGYGMTECGPLISYTNHKDFIPGSAGRTLPGIMYSKVLSDNEAYIPGEICVKGENVMKGYYKNPKATAEVLDKDGWLHTGDMGTISNAGTIFIKGRYKTMILSANGQNIYPEEIEAKLSNMPYVGEALVVERGKKLVALVYPDYEAMDKARLTHEMMPQVMEKIRQEVNKNLAPYEQIDEIQLRANEFEKTPKKSIKRFLYS